MPPLPPVSSPFPSPPLESLPLPPPWKCDRVHGAMHSYSLPPIYNNVVPLCLLFASIRFPIPVTIIRLPIFPPSPSLPTSPAFPPYFFFQAPTSVAVYCLLHLSPSSFDILLTRFLSREVQSSGILLMCHNRPFLFPFHLLLTLRF